MQAKRFKKILITILKLGLSAVAVYIVLRKINLNQLKNILLTANFGWLLLATIFFILSKTLSALRLNLFLKDEDVNISEEFNLKLYLLGMYYNLFLPGGIGGDGYKVYLLNKLTGVKVKQILRAVLMDRITGVLALFVITLVLSVYLPLSRIWIVMLLLCIPVSFVVFQLIIRRFFKQYLQSFSRTNLMAVGVQLLQLISVVCIMMATGTHNTIGQYSFIFFVSSVIATIPFTIGGVGAREVTFLIGANILGLSPEGSLSISILFFIITALISLCGIYYSVRSPRWDR